MSDEDLVEACPNCDNYEFNERTDPDRPPAERFWCGECETEFAEPVERPPKPKVGKLSSAGRAALAWSADDEGGEA